MTIRNYLLAALLITQLVLIGVAGTPKATSTNKTVNLLDCDPQAVRVVTITDDKDITVTLEKEEAGWQINPPDNFPAGGERIESLVTKLCGLQSSQLVSQTKGSHSRLKVSPENFNRRIELQDKEGKSQTLYIGTDQGSSGVHVLLQGSDNVYFAKGLSSWEYATGPRSWWQSLLVNLDENKLKTVELERGAEKLVLKRTEDGTWTDAKDTPLGQKQAKDLIDTARTITISDYLDSKSEEKLEQVALTLRLTDQEGKTVTVEVGPERGENKKDHLARQVGGEHLVVVSGANVEPLFSATLEGLQPVEEAKQRTQK